MNKFSSIFLMLLLSSFLFACNSSDDSNYDDVDLDPNKGTFAKLETDMGTILIKLFHEEVPITVDNFVQLAEGTKADVDSIYKGKPFYDGTIFHRVIDGFMIQGGSPDGKPNGGPGYKFSDEFKSNLRHSDKGVVAMANSGKDTNGSQFYITLDKTPWLDFKHTVFGRVIEGQSVVDEIGKQKTHVGKPNDNRPIVDIILKKVTIIYKHGEEEEK